MTADMVGVCEEVQAGDRFTDPFSDLDLYAHGDAAAGRARGEPTVWVPCSMSGVREHAIPTELPANATVRIWRDVG